MRICLCTMSDSSYSHTLTITCTCCYDEIKGTQDLKIYSHAHSLILSRSRIGLHTRSLLFLLGWSLFARAAVSILCSLLQVQDLTGSAATAETANQPAAVKEPAKEPVKGTLAWHIAQANKAVEESNIALGILPEKPVEDKVTSRILLRCCERVPTDRLFM